MDWIEVGWMVIIGQGPSKSTFVAKKNSRDTEKSREAIFLPPGAGVPALLIRKLYCEVMRFFLVSSVDNTGRILGDMDLIVEFRRRGTSTRSQPSNSGEAHSYSRRYGDLQSDGTWGRGWRKRRGGSLFGCEGSRLRELGQSVQK